MREKARDGQRWRYAQRRIGSSRGMVVEIGLARDEDRINSVLFLNSPQ